MYSLWTYIHRVLHLLGISSIDAEELSLISAPLVRLRHVRTKTALSHETDVMYPEEPLCFSKHTTDPSALFYLHFIELNRARLATAHQRANEPRAWIALDAKTGAFVLTDSERSAVMFEIRALHTQSPAQVALVAPCAAGRYLTAGACARRARVCAQQIRTLEMFVLNCIPLAPTLGLPVQNDATIAAACATQRDCPVRIQSVAMKCFLASSPGMPVAAAASNESGWDAFVLEYDCATRSASIRDSRGLYLTFTSDFQSLIAASPNVHTHESVACKRPERFVVDLCGDDDRITLRSRKGYVSCRRGGVVYLSKDTRASRRQHFYLRIALPSMMDQSSPSLRLRNRADGVRHVEATVSVPASVQVAYEVLRDYNGFYKFISDAVESRILETHDNNRYTMRMVQSHSFLILTLHLSMILDVVEDPERLSVSMDMKRGLGVKVYKGTWSAIPRADGRCTIRCSLMAAPAIPAPRFLVDGVITHATAASMEQVRTECIRRSTLVHTPLSQRTSTGASVDVTNASVDDDEEEHAAAEDVVT